MTRLVVFNMQEMEASKNWQSDSLSNKSSSLKDAESIPNLNTVKLRGDVRRSLFNEHLGKSFLVSHAQ